MYRVVRGLFFDGTLPDAAIQKGQATANHGAVRKDRLLQLSGPEERVLDYLLEFHARQGEAPSYQVAYEHFERMVAPDETGLVEAAMANTFREGATFVETFEEVVEHQGLLSMRDTMKEALEIAQKGVLDTRTGETTRGVASGAAHLYSHLRTPPPKDQGKVPSDFGKAADGLRNLYDERKANPAGAFGVMTGYPCLDGRVGGVRKKQLYIHAGFSNHLKSTFLLNQCVNAVTRGYSVLLFSAEMDSTDLMMLAISIHSADPKFRNKGELALDSNHLLTGTLPSPTDEVQFDVVRRDLAENPAHGSIRVIDSSEFTTFGSVMQRTVREHSVQPVDLLWIDYLTRLPLDVKYARTDHTHAMNLTIQEAKQFAMAFDGGEGLPVCTAFQVNRDGLRKAQKNGGHLDATALGQYNAAEKEADWITYTWYDVVERRESSCKIGMIKSRFSGVMLDPATLYYDESSRRIEETVRRSRMAQMPVGGGIGEVDFSGD